MEIQSKYITASFLEIIKIAFPYTISSLISFLNTIVLFTFVGHLEKPVLLAALGASLSVVTVCISSIITGYSLCLDTLMTQAQGRGDSAEVNTLLNKCRIFIFMVFIPIYTYTNVVPIAFKYFGYTPDVIYLMRWLVPFFGIEAFFLGHYTILSRYLIVKGKARIPTLINLFGLLCTLVFCYIFISVMHFNVLGVAFSIILTYIVNNMIAYYYIVSNDISADLNCFKLDYIKDTSVIRLGLFSILLSIMELWAFELVTVFIGSLSEISLSTQTLVIMNMGLVMQFPIGLSVASAVLVGGSVSVGNVSTARYYCVYTLILGFIGYMPFLAIFILRPYWFLSLFTNIPEVIELFGQLLAGPLLPIYSSAVLLGCLAGTVRGLGLQRYASRIISIYWIYCVPVTAVSVYHWKLNMVDTYWWFGCGVYTYTIGIVLMLIFSTWKSVILEKNMLDLKKELDRERENQSYYSTIGDDLGDDTAVNLNESMIYTSDYLIAEFLSSPIKRNQSLVLKNTLNFTLSLNLYKETKYLIDKKGIEIEDSTIYDTNEMVKLNGKNIKNLGNEVDFKDIRTGDDLDSNASK